MNQALNNESKNINTIEHLVNHEFNRETIFHQICDHKIHTFVCLLKYEVNNDSK